EPGSDVVDGEVPRDEVGAQHHSRPPGPPTSTRAARVLAPCAPPDRAGDRDGIGGPKGAARRGGDAGRCAENGRGPADGGTAESGDQWHRRDAKSPGER